MGALVLKVDIGAGGPLLEGRATHVIEAWQRETVRELADEGVTELRGFVMNKTGRSRGNFRSSVRSYQEGAFARIPGPMIEGYTWAPWLEGNSRRNQSTRFKGYRLFRITAARLNRRAKGVGEAVLSRLIGELGGK